MARPASSSDFDSLCWHDNALYGLRLDVGDHTRGDWRSDLVLDIDHIDAWPRDPDAKVRFSVAPATLTFHDVTDLKIEVDHGDSGNQVALHALSIDAISRERLQDQKICLDRPYYRWRISLNLPQSGEITFGASGFTQVLRAEPIVQDQQQLSPRERAQMSAR